MSDEPTDYEKHYAVHADPNRERWAGGIYDVPGMVPPPGVGGGANAPKATGLDPSSCAIGDPDFVLSVYGLNLTPDVLVVFDGTPIVTTFVSATELACDLRPDAFTEARGYPVSVQLQGIINPTATMFTVTEPAAPLHVTTKKNRRR